MHLTYCSLYLTEQFQSKERLKLNLKTTVSWKYQNRSKSSLYLYVERDSEICSEETTFSTTVSAF